MIDKGPSLGNTGPSFCNEVFCSFDSSLIRFPFLAALIFSFVSSLCFFPKFGLRSPLLAALSFSFVSSLLRFPFLAALIFSFDSSLCFFPKNGFKRCILAQRSRRRGMVQAMESQLEQQRFEAARLRIFLCTPFVNELMRIPCIVNHFPLYFLSR